MAVSGVRARRFIQPAGGASSIFARKRGMVAPAPARAALPAADEKENNSRFGRAKGRDYGNFFSKKRNSSALQGAVNALKGLLVGTLIAAKSLGSTLKSVVGQINGFVSNKGGGLFGKLGTIGLVAAVVVGVAAIFGPQIKKAFDFLKTKAEEIFQQVKQALDDANDRLRTLYDNIKDYVNNTVFGMIDSVNALIASIKPIANNLFHLPTSIGPFDVSGISNPIKAVGKALYSFKEIPKPPPLPEFDKLNNGKGINFLSGYDSLGDLGSGMMSGLGGMLGGGLDSITGIVGDMLNNLFASMGLTDKANDATTFLGLGNQFGPSRDLGSGPGISSLIPGGFGGIIPGLQSALGLGGGQQQNGTGATPNYGTGRTEGESGAVQELKEFIASGEGGYNSMNQGTKGNRIVGSTGDASSKVGKNLTDMTIGEVMERQAFLMDKSNPQEGDYGIFAAGKYQITPDTMPDALRHSGLNKSDMFNQANQERLGTALIMGRRPYVGRYIKGEHNDIEGAMMELAREFASMPHPGTGNSLYGSGNAAAHTPAQVRAALQKARANYKPPSAAQPTAQPQAQSAKDAFIPPKKAQQISFLNNIGFTGGNQVAAAQPRPRPDISPENVGSHGSPNYSFFDPSFPDPFGMNSLEVFA